MNISSAQPSYSITSSDSITIDLSNVTGVGSGGFSGDTITLSNISSGGYTIGSGVTTGSWTSTSGGAYVSFTDGVSEYSPQEEWTNCFPDFDRVQEMCKQYPGLKIAYEKFVTTYKLVKDDYDTPEDQRPKP